MHQYADSADEYSMTKIHLNRAQTGVSNDVKQNF
jgi:hypothetical protein